MEGGRFPSEARSNMVGICQRTGAERTEAAGFGAFRADHGGTAAGTDCPFVAGGCGGGR